MVNIEGLNKADVLAALYNDASKPLGIGWNHYTQEDMSREEAQFLLDHHKEFGYLNGRVIKVNLSSDVSFDDRLYDQNIGDGAAQSVVNKLRSRVQSSSNLF